MFKPQLTARNFEAAVRDSAHVDAEVRCSALIDLARHAEDDPTQVAKVLTGALADTEAAVRSAAAVALADAHIDDTIGALASTADDAEPEVRAMTIMAIGELADAGDKTAVAAIEPRLLDPTAAVRFQAIIAYVRLEKSRTAVIKALLAGYQDDDALVAHIALRMSEELGAGPTEKGGPNTPEKLVAEELLDGAAGLLDHDSIDVRVAAAIIVRRCGRPAGDQLLVDVTNGTIETAQLDDEVTAIELCGTHNLVDATPGLLRRAFGGLIKQDRTAWQSKVALAALGNERGVKWVLRELNAWNKERRTLAVAAAGRAKLEAALPIIEKMVGRPLRALPDAVQDALDQIRNAQ